MVILFFVGVFLVLHSIYEEKLQAVRDNVKIEYRFVPRSYYEEQMDAHATSDKVQDLFRNSNPAFDVASLPDNRRSNDIKAQQSRT